MTRKPNFDWSMLQPGETGESRSSAASGCAAAPVSMAENRAAAPGDRPLTTFSLRANDLKQYAYCPRIVFYQYTMPVQRKPTFKMEHGKIAEARIQRLETRRKLRAYGLADGTRQFQVWLTSPRLGLSGRLDLLITTARGAFPVDFKDTREPVYRNHRVQLCAYALLVEDVLHQPVPAAFIYRVPRDDVAIVAMTAALRAETRQCIAEIHELIAAERMPAATQQRGRCADCEYRNYCGDIF
ncbi:MAG: CRISPR-associated protein Cas4 [Candidatus Binatia bacterium]